MRLLTNHVGEVFLLVFFIFEFCLAPLLSHVLVLRSAPQNILHKGVYLVSKSQQFSKYLLDSVCLAQLFLADLRLVQSSGVILLLEATLDSTLLVLIKGAQHELFLFLLVERFELTAIVFRVLGCEFDELALFASTARRSTNSFVSRHFLFKNDH